MKIDKIYLNGYSNDVIIAGLYIPCEHSTFYNCQEENNGIEDLINELVDVSVADNNLLLMGDFNARTGDMPDYIIDDNVNYLEFPEWWSVDQFNIPRQSRDKNGPINSFGRSLLALCKQCQIHMLNGRSPNDQYREYTFCSTTGQSLVDYVLVSTSLFEQMDNFCIGDRDESDHFPISCSLQCSCLEQNSFEKTSVEGCIGTLHRFQWDMLRSNDFRTLLTDQESSVYFENFNYNILQGNVNSALENIIEALQRASLSMKHSRKYNHHKCDASKKPKQNAPWWDPACEQAKCKKGQLLYMYRTTRTNADLEKYLVSKKYYKSLCKQKMLEYRKHVFKDLRESTKCSNSVWACIQKCSRVNNNKLDDSITPEMWLDHFTSLLNQTDDINTDNNFKEAVENFITHHDTGCESCVTNDPQELNDNITLSEIESVIKVLPTGKQPGTDGLAYEFFKYSFDIIGTYICSLFNAVLLTGIFPNQWCEAISSHP